MEFNMLVKAQIFTILQKYGFEIAEERKNILLFQSSGMKVNIVFNRYDRSFLVEIGKQDNELYPLNDYVVKELFHSSLSIEQVTPEIFVQNLSIIFETKEGAEILKGDISSFIEFKLSEINNYNTELFKKQCLEFASRAWDIKDYVAFVESIDRIGISKIPKSYQLKYEIAKQKL
ncbi:MAG: hypothetical protein KBA02_05285 [Paludibacteraceae bacterium]|nr:hypothetical protein [Paludibacteraceae bacterium]